MAASSIGVLASTVGKKYFNHKKYFNRDSEVQLLNQFVLASKTWPQYAGLSSHQAARARSLCPRVRAVNTTGTPCDNITTVTQCHVSRHVTGTESRVNACVSCQII